MSLIRPCLPALLALSISACAVPTGDNPYQQQSASSAAPGQGAVAELQQQARAALEQGAIAQARDYLQRAIRIEPRNPHSWHYLAQSYRQGGDFARCLQMTERSHSYSRRGDGLDAANQRLKRLCGGN